MRVSERGQVTIPKTLRDKFGMNHNVEVEFEPTEHGLLLKKSAAVSHPLERVFGIFEGIDSTDEFIEAIRGR
ncbi:MAG: AbrB/MazE/SpoVT family DNA-binding domain-containing protein [Gammaproteobacteria bacterium]|nr:AbrB/MazE/SpoVT family DNA-binding domain-containing protein [Gammaproteobacteria bacterium]